MKLMYLAVFGLTIVIVDVVNRFQDILLEENKYLVITAPPYYIQFFHMTYPEVKIVDSPSGDTFFNYSRDLKEISPSVASDICSSRGSWGIMVLSHVAWNQECTDSIMMT